jgi:hypothetical protein
MNICELCCIKKHKLLALPCDHSICRKCKSKWLKINPTCPFCRAYVPKKYDSEYFDIYIKNHLIQIGKLVKRNKCQMKRLFKIENQIISILEDYAVHEDIDIPYILSYPHCLDGVIPRNILDELFGADIVQFNKLLSDVNATDDAIFFEDEVITNIKYRLYELFADKTDLSSKSIIKYLDYSRNPNINP